MSDPSSRLERLRSESDAAFQEAIDFEGDLIDHHAIPLKDRDADWESRLQELEGSKRDANAVYQALYTEVHRLEQVAKSMPATSIENTQLPPLTGSDALHEELGAGSLPIRPMTINDVHNFETPLPMTIDDVHNFETPLTTSGLRKSLGLTFGAVALVLLGVGFFALRSNDEAVSPVPVTVADTVPETVPPVTVAEVVLPQAATAAQAGYSCVGEQFQLFESSNIYLVSGGGGTPPTFSTGGKPYCLTSVSTYHWNDGNGAAPGKVGLRGTQEMVGPAQAQGTSGQGGAQNVNWVYVPASDALPLLNGQYTCTDSDSATWSQNKESGGQGFCRIWVQTAQK